MSMYGKLCVAAAAFLAVSFLVARDAHAEESTARPTPSNVVTVVGASAAVAGYAPMFVMGSASLVHGIANFKVLCGGHTLVSGGRCPENDAIVLLVPVVGPLIYAQPSTGDDLYRRDRGPSGTEQALLYSSAALQLGGLVTAIVGDSLRRADLRASSARSSAYVTPMLSPGSSGVMIGSSF